MKIEDIEARLRQLGYKTKLMTKTRVAVITDKRQDALNKILKDFKRLKAVLNKDRRSLNVSSIGVIKVGNFQIIAKPESRNVLKAEQEATESLIKLINDAVDQEGGPINININRYRLRNCRTAGADQIKGDPKADIAIIDENRIEVGFISHKKEGGARAFQQYGGISEKSGSIIYDDPIVVSFVKDLQEELLVRFNSDTVPPGFCAFRYIPNTVNGQALVSRSVYGPKWTKGNRFNRDSVHCIGQGSPILTRRSDGSYNLTFSESTHYSSQINWAFRGDYQAVLAITYRAGRKVQNRGIVLRDVRAGIYPYDFVRLRQKVEI